MSAAVNVLSLDSDWVLRVIKGKVGDCVYQNSKPSFLALTTYYKERSISRSAHACCISRRKLRPAALQGYAGRVAT